ncbi:uncharacterized protein LOC144388236 [Gasterosteus aculeatus]
MAGTGVISGEQEALVSLEEKPLEAPEEPGVRALCTARGEHGDESDAPTKPLLRHQHQDAVCDESDRSGLETSTDGHGRRTSVPPELQLAARDEPGRGGSVGSLSSDSCGNECPICSELFDSHGDRRVTLLHCNHVLCHHCAAGIMRRAKDPSRLQCPFCRQTTPFPQWEIRRLQEESYGGGFYDPGPPSVVSSGPEFPAVPEPSWCCVAVLTHRDARCEYPSCLVGGSRSLCFTIAALLLLFLLLLGVFLYMVVPLILLSVLFTSS